MRHMTEPTRRLARAADIELKRRTVLGPHDVLTCAEPEGFTSPGAGKTAFLEKTLTLMKQRYRPAALVGDLATDNDAARLARSQAPVKQITTGTLCHLEAAMVDRARSRTSAWSAASAAGRR